MGGMFFILKGKTIYFYTLLASILSAVIHGCLSAILSPVGLPPLTFPFNLVCWIFCLSGNNMKNLFSVELAALSIPEDHKKRYDMILSMTSKFKDIQEF